ncbi:MAG: glycosyltransferase family 4 protein [Desulfosalsimonadaceae bacterium]
MKFAFCLFKYFPYGGLQRGFLQLARTCVARGHQVDVYTGSWEGEKPENLNIFIIPNRRLTNHGRYQSFARRVQRLTGPANYDAVVGFNKMPGLDVYFASDVCYACRAGQRSLVYRLSGRCRTLTALERAVFNKHSNTQIISISDAEIKRYMACYGTSASRFHPVPPGISRDRLNAANEPGIRDAWRREFAVEPEQNIVLMLGSDYRRKGVDRAIKAISALPPGLKNKTRLVVVGKGRTRPYQRLANRLNVSSHLYFAGERDDAHRFLAGADLMLHPAYHETAGAVLIEAMAAGLPVLATDTCGYSFHVERAGAGELVPSPFRQEKMNIRLAFMLSSDKRKQWGLNGREYVRKTDVYSRHEKAADVIEEVAAGRRLV